jgi:tetratricopeptide (TPR) repeat protein
MKLYKKAVRFCRWIGGRYARRRAFFFGKKVTRNRILRHVLGILLLGFCVLVLLTGFDSLRLNAQSLEETQAVPIKKLRGKKYSEAMNAQNMADLKRAEFEKRYSPVFDDQGNMKELPNQKQMDVEAAKVAQAYQEVLDRYPHTEVAAYCAARLSGLYLFQGKLEKAVELMEQTAREFAGTTEEDKAVFVVGLIHEQARHDPAEAIKWFSRISKPEQHAGSSYGEEGKLYLSAQEQLAKCELALKQDAHAQKRTSALKEDFPQFKDELSGEYQFEVDSRNQPVASLSKHKPMTSKTYVKYYTTAILASVTMVLIVVLSYRQVRRKS